jgi:hypothetical protein
LSSSQITNTDYPDSWKWYKQKKLFYDISLIFFSADTFSDNNALQIDAIGLCVDGTCRICDPTSSPENSVCNTGNYRGPARVCVSPGTYVGYHGRYWAPGLYYENPTNVWWAIFFCFLILMMAVQAGTLFFTFRK